jgi:hypothetical protein
MLTQIRCLRSMGRITAALQRGPHM